MGPWKGAAFLELSVIELVNMLISKDGTFRKQQQKVTLIECFKYGKEV